jgi:subtilisin family serine protease
MKIKLLKDAYLRTSAVKLEQKPFGIVFKGTVVEVLDEVVVATSLKGNPVWYADKRGWFIWSGAAEIVEKEVELSYLPIEDTSNIKYLSEKSLEWYNNHKGLNWAIIRERIVDKVWQKKDLTGRGVRVAILDSGIDVMHPDLDPCIQAYGNFSVSNFTTKKDILGSGTRMASIIAAQGRFKVTGVAPSAQLYIGKVMNFDHQIDPDSLISALKWSYQLKADIVLLGPNFHKDAFTAAQLDELKQLVATFSSLGTIFVSPAGNMLTEVDVPSIFKTFKEVIIVGSHTFENTIQPFSYFGKEVDTFAPGDRLLCAKQNGETGFLSGTKASASFVTGVLALMLQFVKQVGLELEPLEWKKLVKESGVPIKESSSEISSTKRIFSSEKLLQLVERKLKENRIFNEN